MTAISFVRRLLAARLNVALCSPRWASARATGGVRKIAVAPRYETTHVYVAPEDVDRFAGGFIATFAAQGRYLIAASHLPFRGIGRHTTE